MSVDLHIHSQASDGALDAAAIVAIATRSRLTAIAIADHDAVDAVDAAVAAAAALADAPRVVPAVELSARALDGRSVHVLGYFVDTTSEPLTGFLAAQRVKRLRRARVMVDSLAAAGYPVTLSAVLGHANGSVGRTHVALALVESGAVPSIGAAFADLIGRGKPHYVPKDVPDASEAIRIIHGAGGVAVVAHPAVSGVVDLIPALADAGLDGIEAFHARHSRDQRDSLVALAAELGLAVTGGSDFHGHDGDTSSIGAGGAPDSVLQSLTTAHRRRTAQSAEER